MTLLPSGREGNVCSAPAARRKSLAGIAARCPCCIAATTRGKRSRRVSNCLADNTVGAAARPPIADTKADNWRG